MNRQQKAEEIYNVIKNYDLDDAINSDQMKVISTYQNWKDVKEESGDDIILAVYNSESMKLREVLYTETSKITNELVAVNYTKDRAFDADDFYSFKNLLGLAYSDFVLFEVDRDKTLEKCEAIDLSKSVGIITVENPFSKVDMVNHPSHYNFGEVEVIDYINQVCSSYKNGTVAYCIGNVIKYVSRAPFKNGIQDLEKAKWYLDYAIKKSKENKVTQDGK